MWALWAALVLAAAAAPAPQKTYTTKYDRLDVRTVLANERLVNFLFACLMAEKNFKCSPEGVVLKTLIPDAISNDCARCTPKQREATEEVIAYMMVNRPREWQMLQAKFDPTGRFIRRIAPSVEAKIEAMTGSRPPPIAAASEPVASPVQPTQRPSTSRPVVSTTKRPPPQIQTTQQEESLVQRFGETSPPQANEVVPQFRPNIPEVPSNVLPLSVDLTPTTTQRPPIVGFVMNLLEAAKKPIRVVLRAVGI